MSDIVIKIESGSVAYTGLTPALTISPFTASSYTGTEVASGYYSFTNVGDGVYKLYEAADLVTEIATFGGTNGRWIGDSSLTGYVLLANNNTFTGNNTFSGTTTLGSDTSIGDVSSTEISYVNGVTSNIQDQLDTKITTSSLSNYLHKSSSAVQQVYSHVGFRNTCTYIGSTTNANDLINRSALDGALYQVTNNLTSSYQQSPNVVRLVPNGIQETNRLYTTYATALSNVANRTPSSGSQFTIWIESEGLSATSSRGIDMAKAGDGYAFDYVHFRGISADIRLVVPGAGINASEWTGSAADTITYEDINFYFNDGGGANSAECNYITYKNCSFELVGDATWTFTNCKFEGLNNFKGVADGTYIFTNCSGDAIYTNTTPTFNTTYIDYFKSNSLRTNTISTHAGNLDLKTGLILSGSLIASGSAINVTGDIVGSGDITAAASFQVGGDSGLDQNIDIPDGGGQTHHLTFKGGILTAYSTD